MRILPWDELPLYMQNDEVKKYYNNLVDKQGYLKIKRCIDIIVSILVLIILIPLFIIISILIKYDSSGPVLYKQKRVTQYGRIFHIYKFRTMIVNADSGFQITQYNDSRITKIGKILRRYKLDELPQFYNVLTGSLTLCGTRPENPKFVNQYSNEMLATLLLPAGITSLTSIKFTNEALLIQDVNNFDEAYINYILPEKMKYNLQELEQLSFLQDIKILIATFLSLFN